MRITMPLNVADAEIAWDGANIAAAHTNSAAAMG
jgi:hypothetical protein